MAYLGKSKLKMVEVLFEAIEADMETLRSYVTQPWLHSHKVGAVAANRIHLNAEAIQHRILPGGLKPNVHIDGEEDTSPDRVSLFGKDIGILRINDVEE